MTTTKKGSGRVDELGNLLLRRKGQRRVDWRGEEVKGKEGPKARGKVSQSARLKTPTTSVSARVDREELDEWN